MTQINQIEGFFLSFSGDEVKDVKEELIERGFTGDSEGLKAFLMEMLFADDTQEEANEEGRTDRVINTVRGFIEENPDTVRMAMNGIAGMVGRLVKKPR